MGEGSGLCRSGRCVKPVLYTNPPAIPGHKKDLTRQMMTPSTSFKSTVRTTPWPTSVRDEKMSTRTTIHSAVSKDVAKKQENITPTKPGPEEMTTSMKKFSILSQDSITSETGITESTMSSDYNRQFTSPRPNRKQEVFDYWSD